MDSFIIQPTEKFFIQVTFEALDDAETITLGSSSAGVTDASGNDVPGMIDSGTLAVVDNNKLKVRVIGGTDGQDYKLTLKAVTDAGNTFEKDIKIRVREG